MQETRQYERKAVSLRPRYRVATQLDYTESECLDLSAGGMFIESPAPAKPGTLVKLECSGEQGAFRGLGKVAWRRDADDAGPGGMGIRFLKLEADGGDVVERLLASARPGRSAVAAAALPASRSPFWLTIAALLAMLVGAAIILIGSR